MIILQNYRPNSLICILCNVFERFVVNRLQKGHPQPSNQLDMVPTYAHKLKFNKSIENSCVVAFPYRKQPLPFSAYYYGHKLQEVEISTHLGLILDTKLNSKHRLRIGARKARTHFTLYVVEFHLSLHITLWNWYKFNTWFDNTN